MFGTMRQKIVESVLRNLGTELDGLASRDELRARGLPVHAIDRLVRVGRVTVVARGVYLLGPLPAVRTAERAALLAAAPNARLSHRTAARLLGIVDGNTAKPGVEIALPRGRRCRMEGVRIHRTRGFRDDEVTEIHGLRTTTPARTLLDLAESCCAREVEQAYATALRRRLVTPEEMRAIVARHPHHRGAAFWRKLFRQPDDPAFARSVAEEKMLALVDVAGLPRPEMNVRVLGYEVDFHWPEQRVIVETDGYVFHVSADSFAADRRRDAELSAAGYRILRFTWSDLVARRAQAVGWLAQTLAR